MRLLVTRPEEDAVAFKAHLIAQGHQVTIEPLLVINTDDADEIDLEGAQAIMATSRNGLRALAKSGKLDAAFATNCDPITGKYPRDPSYDRLLTHIVMRAPAPIGLGKR